MKQTVEEAARENILFNHRTVDRTLIGKDLARFGEINFIQGAEWQSKQSLWISVKERLPKHNIEVIICHEREFYIGKMYYCMQSNWWRVSDDERTDMIVNEDDSWMPIPSFDEILEANRDVLERIKEKGD